MHAIYVNGGKTPAVVQSESSSWRPRQGDYPWKVVDQATGQVVESYSPPRTVKAKPITSFAGSWADTVNRT